ncbi:DUF4347 domain-containing protein, partial [Novipirellula herctigrandis]
MSLWLRDLWQQTLLTLDEAATRMRASTGRFPGNHRAPHPTSLASLEPRILFSAAPIDVATVNGGEDTTAMVAELEPATANAVESTETESQHAQLAIHQANEIVIIDSRVSDIEQLLGDLNESDRNVDVYVLDADRDGVDQITEILGSRTDVTAIHLVTHAEDGAVKLGNTWLGQSNLDGYAGQIASWQSSLSSDADMLLYGCDLAASEDGRTLIESLSALSGADVAASDDDTGHVDYQGDWLLEYTTGDIESSIAFSENLQQTWHNKLATLTITVDTFDDVVNGGDAFTSLREAVIAANTNVGDDVTIVLQAGTYTRLLNTTGEDAAATGDLDITRDVKIVGAGAGATFIDAGYNDRVFEVHGAHLVMSDLTVTAGVIGDYGGGIHVADAAAELTLDHVDVTDNGATEGAGIYNAGTMTLTDVEIFQNGGTGSTNSGGGIFNDGTATLNRVTLTENGAGLGGAIYNENSSISMSLTNVTISNNQAVTNGGGIYNKNSSLTIVNSTITLNSADTGGGIWSTGGPIPDLLNTIVAGNTAGTANPDVQGDFVSSGNNLIGDVGTATGFGGSDITGQSPLLAALADNGGFPRTHALLTGSPAINTGATTGAPAVDQRGMTRDISPDIGAFEAASATFVVTTTADSGAGSLRQAIIDANASTGADIITFSIAGTGVHIITPIGALPTITERVTIDATTDDSFAANGNRPAITLDGSSSGAANDGFVLSATADGTTIRGFVISDWDGDGIEIQAGSDNNTIVGNYIGRLNSSGTDSGAGTQNTGNGVLVYGANNTIGGLTESDRNIISGNNSSGVVLSGGSATGNAIVGNFIGVDLGGHTALGNTNNGVVIMAGAASNTIGGNTASARNIISGNSNNGIRIQDAGSNNNLVQMNYIGVDVEGDDAVGNSLAGVNIGGAASSNTIGGAGLGNVVSGNTNGIQLWDGGTTGNVIAGNFVGVDATATTTIGNTSQGIQIGGGAAANTIGGTTVAEGNIVGGNGFAGVEITNAGSNDNIVQGNLIGTNSGGILDLGNDTHGILIQNGAIDNAIGGVNAGEGNVIAFSGEDGVRVLSSATGNSILGNTIFSNDALGIDIDSDSVSANDVDDVDTGTNDLMNFPVIKAVVQNGADLGIVFDADLAAGTYRIEFFENPAGADPSGYGEAQAFLGATTIISAGAAGSQSYRATLTGVTATAIAGITATTTEDRGGGFYGSTSEFSAAHVANQITVTTTDDTLDGDTTSLVSLFGSRGADGEISLREAMEAANNTANAAAADQILFDIAGTGPHVIELANALGQLPTITDAVVIDATSEPDYASTPNVVIDGNLLSGSLDGITVTSGGSTIKGFAVINFGGDGIFLSGGGSNTILGNYIGVDVDGTGAGNSSNGLQITNSANNQIGGIGANEGNVIGDNGGLLGDGINIVGAGSIGNIIVSNYIGTDPTGMIARANSTQGIYIAGGATNTMIGGPTAAHGNVISGNLNDGIELSGSTTTGHQIFNNLIGIASDGTTVLSNGQHGVNFEDAPDNVIGSVGNGNVISGHGSFGINIAGVNATGNTVQGNFIGTDAAATLNLGNSSGGIRFNNKNDTVIPSTIGNPSGNLIGGANTGEGNVIAYNLGDGIDVRFGTGNELRANTIYSNTGLGIDLAANGVTANDVGDADTGVNNLQNTPVLTSAIVTGTDLTLTGTFNSASSSTYEVDFFASSTADASGSGEAERYLGSVSIATNVSGDATISEFLSNASVAAGEFITATATDQSGNTSEFSVNAVATGPISTLLDQFNAVDYAGNDGTKDFDGSWQELGESDGTNSGRIRVVSSDTTNALRIGGDEVTLDGRGVQREANLSGANAATLTFDYRRTMLDESGGSVSVEVSGNGGSSWTTLQTYNLNTTDGSYTSQSFDILSYAADDTMIRFIGSGEVESYFYADNIQIEYDGTASVNAAPTSTGFGDIAVQQDASSTTIDLFATFADAEDLDTALTYSVTNNSNATLVSTSINAPAGQLMLTYGAGETGQANITLRAVDTGGKFVESTFQVTVTAELADKNETFVNTETNDIQETSAEARGSDHAVAIANNGDYVVVWSSKAQDTSGWGVYGQRFDKDGSALGGEFRVTQTDTNDEQWASVAMNSTGEFVVTWTANGQDGSSHGVYARAYDATGTAVTNELLVNSTTSGEQKNSSIGMDSLGNFVVMWQGEGIGDANGIFVRRFNADGTARDAAEVLVNTSTASIQYDAAISVNAHGDFVITWDDPGGFHFRRFSNAGIPQGTQTNVDSSVNAGNGSIALHDDGSFVAVWRDGLTTKDVQARRYDNTGTPIGAEFTVNSTTANNQTAPSIDMDASGNFIITWEGEGPGDVDGIFGQKYDSNGAAIGGEFLINGTTSGTQNQTSVAMLDSDNFVVVWSGNGTGDSDGVYAKQFGTASAVNTAPNADTGGSYTINEGDSLNLDASGSTDSDLDTLSYEWDLNGDLSYDVTTATPTVSWASLQSYNIDNEGSYTIGLRVSDGNGGIDLATTTVTVNNVAPNATDDNYAADLNTALVIGSGSGLLDNDTDPVDTLVAEVVTGPSNGVLTLDPLSLGTYTNLTNDVAVEGQPVWSPDGSKIAFFSGVTGDRQIYVMNSDGSGVAQLTTDAGVKSHQPAWSPDSTKLAVTSDRYVNDEVVIIDASDGTELLRLTNDGGVDHTPAWSPDGTKIAFGSNRTGAYEIWVTNSDGSGIPTQLTFAGAVDRSAEWSPDGSKLVFRTSRDGNPDIYVMDADGSNQIQLTSDLGADIQPAWSPDGSRIAFVSDRNGNNDVFVMNADGSNQVSLGTTAAVEIELSWSPDGTQLVISADDEIQVANIQFDGTFTYTPDTGFTGTDTFDYVASDGASVSAAATATVTVTDPNQAPTADAGGTYTINEGDSLSLVGSGSSDPDGDTLSYAWDLDNDGDFGDTDEPTTATPTIDWATLQNFLINDDGSYTIGLQVRDGRGGVDTTTVNVTVNNVAPTLTVSGATTVVNGTSYLLNLSAVDPGSDTIASWTINWGDGSIETIVGNPSTASHVYGEIGYTYNILASATDEDGTYLQNELLLSSYTGDSVLRFAATTGTFL